ncbi:MAG: endolytic transglycosylase MltG [Pseudomonadota bacterium]
MSLKRKKSRRFGLLKIAALLAVMFFLVSNWFSFQRWLEMPLTIPVDGYYYDLGSGKSISHLTQDLANKNILTHPRWLGWYARYYQKEKIHTGEYFFPVGITPLQLLEKLNKGDVVLHQVTLLEGWTFRQIIAALNEQPELTHQLTHKTMAEQLAILNLPISHVEGWFYPDTYRFTKGTSDVELLRQSYKVMRKTLDEMWATKAANLPYANDYQALIMASIVEKETGWAGEREQVAGVFVRRLQQGMRLQTDPTVIYGMGADYAGKISKNDLVRANQYNTYVINGLPPTPIATPSKASLYAALHPAPGNALFFVAKGDGTSEFSATLIEHQRAVVRYQLKRRSDYRSAPK